MREDESLRAPSVYHRYQAYLLRLWQETPGASWRASLQDAASGELTVFCSMAELVALLQGATAQKDSDRNPVGRT